MLMFNFTALADDIGTDTEEDEFGSWADKRDPEAHHTEGQIAAKKAAAAKKAGNKRQEADEFGPWDTDEDEFGSWADKREADPEAHHTEGQIAAKQAAAAKASTNCKRDPEAHHTEVRHSHHPSGNQSLIFC